MRCSEGVLCLQRHRLMMGDVNQELREFKWFMYGNISDNDGGMHD